MTKLVDTTKLVDAGAYFHLVITSLYCTCISFICLCHHTVSLLREGIFFFSIKCPTVLSTMIDAQKILSNKLISRQLKLLLYYYEFLCSWVFKELNMCPYNFHNKVLKVFSFILIDPLTFPGSFEHPQIYEIY